MASGPQRPGNQAAAKRTAEWWHARSEATRKFTSSAKAPLRPAPIPPRKLTGADLELANRAAAHRDDWARRHPTKAKAERTIRKERAEMAERWPRTAAGTPETLERHRQKPEGALARLCQSGVISADQLAWGVAIAETAARIGADVTVKTASLETRIDSGRHGDGLFREAIELVWREMAYTRWRAELDRPIVRSRAAHQPARASLSAMVLDMIAGDDGYTVVARRRGMGAAKAKRMLLDALDLWPKHMGEICKEVDRATLVAAHAGIL